MEVCARGETCDYGWEATEEDAVHAMFATARLRGEWFRPTDALLAFIERVRAGVALEQPTQLALGGGAS